MENTQDQQDVSDLIELLPTNLVERYPNAEQRIHWIRTNYGVSLRVAFMANSVI